MAFIEDATPFFGDFGVQVTLAGQPQTVIFDDGYAEAFGGMVAGSGHRVVAQASVKAARGQTLLHGFKAYRVTSVEPDGTGLVMLRLEEQ